ARGSRRVIKLDSCVVFFQSDSVEAEAFVDDTVKSHAQTALNDLIICRNDILNHNRTAAAFLLVALNPDAPFRVWASRRLGALFGRSCENHTLLNPERARLNSDLSRQLTTLLQLPN